MTTTNKGVDFKNLVESGYSFGNVVAFFMRDAGVSMADIARSAGITRQAVQYVLKDMRRRSPAVRKMLSKALGFDPSYPSVQCTDG